MANIELVIKIPYEMYQKIKETSRFISGRRSGKRFDYILFNAVNNGTPLPKEHGRLIDADAFVETMKDASKRQKYKEVLIDDCLTVDDVFKAIIESLQNEGLANGDAPTIIEADKAEEDKS